MAYSEEIIENWNYWNYFRRVVRNKNTNSETLLETGRYVPVTTEMFRIGVKISDLTETEEIREYYAATFKPNIRRMCNQDYPSSVTLRILSSVVGVNSDQTEVTGYAKTWYHVDARSWVSTDDLSYSILTDFSIPSDVAAEDYVAEDYTEESLIKTGDVYIDFYDLEAIFWKYMRDKTTGFTLSATGGYVDFYSPNYSPVTFRPQFIISQTVSSRQYSGMVLDAEIKALSRIKGVCKNKYGVAITGSQCDVIAFRPDTYRIVGTGSSSAVDGSFLIDVDYKVGEDVAVSFINSGLSISGTELMTTVSYDTV